MPFFPVRIDVVTLIYPPNVRLTATVQGHVLCQPRTICEKSKLIFGTNKCGHRVVIISDITDKIVIVFFYFDNSNILLCVYVFIKHPKSVYNIEILGWCLLIRPIKTWVKHRDSRWCLLIRHPQSLGKILRFYVVSLQKDTLNQWLVCAG